MNEEAHHDPDFEEPEHDDAEEFLAAGFCPECEQSLDDCVCPILSEDIESDEADLEDLENFNWESIPEE
jgi:hypothetical protein